jgi:hypothetical protein
MTQLRAVWHTDLLCHHHHLTDTTRRIKQHRTNGLRVADWVTVHPDHTTTWLDQPTMPRHAPPTHPPRTVIVTHQAATKYRRVLAAPTGTPGECATCGTPIEHHGDRCEPFGHPVGAEQEIRAA